MDNLLSYAYLVEHCPECKTVVPVTLLEILLEQRVQRNWQSARPCGNCAVPRGHAAPALPENELAQLADAWDALVAEVNARGVPLHVGPWPSATTNPDQ